MNLEATHQPILFYAVELTNKPVLEFGAGESSTRQLNGYPNRILTIDDNIEWVERYKHLASDHHQFMFLPEYSTEGYFESLDKKWGVILVDSSTWDTRKIAIDILADKTDYMVIHDANFGHAINVDFDKFKNWIEFRRIGIDIPTTILASNRIDLTDVVIEDTEIIARKLISL